MAQFPPETFNMTGRQVAEHLMRAGRRSQEGKSYNFPHGIQFPTWLFK